MYLTNIFADFYFRCLLKKEHFVVFSTNFREKRMFNINFGSLGSTYSYFLCQGWYTQEIGIHALPIIFDFLRLWMIKPRDNFYPLNYVSNYKYFTIFWKIAFIRSYWLRPSFSCPLRSAYTPNRATKNCLTTWQE